MKYRTKRRTLSLSLCCLDPNLIRPESIEALGRYGLQIPKLAIAGQRQLRCALERLPSRSLQAAFALNTPM